jgi:hypothetical protein
LEQPVSHRPTAFQLPQQNTLHYKYHTYNITTLSAILHKDEMWKFTLWEEYNYKWTKVMQPQIGRAQFISHNKQLHNLYCSDSKIK